MKFSAFEKRLETKDDKPMDAAEHKAAIKAAIGDRLPAPRDTALETVGADAGIAWWDHVSLPDRLAEKFHGFLAAAADVPEDGFVLADRSVIPEALWVAHRITYLERGHGLKLENEPAMVALVRNGLGQPGFMIGYKVAA